MPSDEKVEAIAAKNQQIIRDFGALLEEVDGTKFYHEKLLPHDKAAIFDAMQIAYAMSQEVGRSVLRAGVISLANFQPDIGPEPMGFALGNLDPSSLETNDLDDAIASNERWQSLPDTATLEIQDHILKLQKIDGAKSKQKRPKTLKVSSPIEEPGPTSDDAPPKPPAPTKPDRPATEKLPFTNPRLGLAWLKISFSVLALIGIPSDVHKYYHRHQIRQSLAGFGFGWARRNFDECLRLLFGFCPPKEAFNHRYRFSHIHCNDVGVALL